MHYYLLESAREGKYAEVHSVVNELDLPVGNQVGEANAAKSKSLSAQLTDNCRCFADCMLSLGMNLLLSEKACNIFSPLNRCPGIIYRNVNIKSKKKILTVYSFCDSNLEHDVLDYQKSIMNKFDGIVIGVNKIVIDAPKAPSYDLIFHKYNRWIVSQNFVDLVGDNKLTGFKFTLLEMT